MAAFAPVSVSLIACKARSIARADVPETFRPALCARPFKPSGRVIVILSIVMHINQHQPYSFVKSKLRRKSRYFSGKFTMSMKAIYQGYGDDDPRILELVYWGLTYFAARQEEFDKGINIDTEVPFALRLSEKRNKICFVKCPGCNTVFTSRSRHFKYCPDCITEHKRDLQRIRRGARACKHCGKSLPKKFPNREYCPGGACRVAAWRERKNDSISPGPS